MGYCRKCRDKWTGLSRCYCTGCHMMFSCVSSFDKHRNNFKCLDPLDVGIEMDKNGIWREPLPESVKIRLGYKP